MPGAGRCRTSQPAPSRANLASQARRRGGSSAVPGAGPPERARSEGAARPAAAAAGEVADQPIGPVLLVGHGVVPARADPVAAVEQRVEPEILPDRGSKPAGERLGGRRRNGGRQEKEKQHERRGYASGRQWPNAGPGRRAGQRGLGLRVERESGGPS